MIIPTSDPTYNLSGAVPMPATDVADAAATGESIPAAPAPADEEDPDLPAASLQTAIPPSFSTDATATAHPVSSASSAATVATATTAASFSSLSTGIPPTTPPPPGIPPLSLKPQSAKRSAKGPRLTLGIPPASNQKPVDPVGIPPGGMHKAKRPPELRLEMPMGASRPVAPPLQVGTIPAGGSGSGGGGGDGSRSRSGSFTTPISNNTDAASAASSISYPDGEMTLVTDSGVPSLVPDLDRLSLDMGRPLDVEDLDDEGWIAARAQNKIIELDVLGEGAGGAVTRCKLKDGKTVFALKIITTDPNPTVKKQIFRELNFNKDCRSEYICRYYGAFMDRSSSTISIAMEFCEGGSLDRVYKQIKKLGGRTGEKVLGKVAEGVLCGLTYLHERKIIHRDIKPSNILLCRNGQVKLIDFGVSGEFGTKGDANTFIGTHYYMAPERITGQSYTITSDVWSLGVSLMEVAQHHFPFPADGRSGLIDLLTYIVSQPVPTLNDEPENGVKWSDNFKSFISCCLERDSHRRPPPSVMLGHAWMVEMSKKKVNMAKFLQQVWNWSE